MQLSSSLIALEFALAVLASPMKRDAATVENDIAAISAQVTKLNNDISTFSAHPSSIADALVRITSRAILDF